MIKDVIRNRLIEALDRLSYLEEGFSPELEVPSSSDFGDYATNAALELGSKLQTNPREIAEDLLEEIDTGPFREVTIDGPGFINFFLGEDLLLSSLMEILEEGPRYGSTNQGSAQRVQVEFVSSNPTGPLTVGHGRQAVLGDILSSLLEKLGYEVTREYYFNDEGRQIDLLAKTLWARYKQALGQEAAVPEEGYQGEYLVELGQELSEELGREYTTWNKATAQKFREIGLREMIHRIKEDLRGVGVKFDNWFKESDLHKRGSVDEVLERLDEKNAIYEKNGAVWLKAKDERGSDDPVLIKSDGSPTYLLPDIAYHVDKLDRGFTKAIVLLGADHQQHVENMKAALSKLEFPSDFYEVHLNQFVSLSEEGEIQRMSTRKGQFVTLSDLVLDLGKDVVRYFMAARKPESHLEFDYELAKEESMDNPVYYLQYAHTRICGIFRNAERGPETFDFSQHQLEALGKEEEWQLIKLLDRFPEIVEKSAQDYSPHTLTAYAEDLAALYHQFYNKYRVLCSDERLMNARVGLSYAVQNVLRAVLDLLGVSAPERM